MLFFVSLSCQAACTIGETASKKAAGSKRYELGGDLCATSRAWHQQDLTPNAKPEKLRSCPFSSVSSICVGFPSTQGPLCVSAHMSVYLSVCLFVCFSVGLSVCLSVCPFACLSLTVYLSISLSVSISLCLWVCLSVCLSLSLSLPISLSVYLPVWLSLVCLPVSVSLPVCLCLCVCQAPLSLSLVPWLISEIPDQFQKLTFCNNLYCSAGFRFHVELPLSRSQPIAAICIYIASNLSPEPMQLDVSCSKPSLPF